MSNPEFLICLDCESPVYVFEWDGERVTEALCTTCGNDKLALFSTDEDYGEMMAIDAPQEAGE
jgi:hypothetical protein